MDIAKILENIKKASDFLETSIQDLVGAWRRGDRFRVLVVGFIAWFFFCASQQTWLKQIIPLLKDIPQLLNQTGLNISWLLAGVLFFWAIYEAARIKQDSLTQDDEKFTEFKAIKGLRPFTKEDREIFQQLGRDLPLKECLAEINRDSFRFGILLGESGCGKTSFLQAGLIPQLCEPASKVHGIYVPFSDRDPLVTIRQAFADKLPLLSEEVNQANFLSLLSQGVEAASKPLVLIFDQFEQFFVHFKRKEDRQFFIQALADWYLHPEPSQVKIFVSIRKDFYGYLLELQKAFGDRYSPSPQEVIELEKFSPEEATKVLEVIANTENLGFDPDFIAEVAAEELASSEDGLISPVDLQILAWIVNKQKTEELKAFNQTALQKLGGIEGLLTHFLEKTLEKRFTEAQREEAVKVLLGLTDLERQVRAGSLTVREIQVKLPDLSTSVIEETIEWLAQGDVRLINSIKREGVEIYELAHERIIPALLKVSGKVISEADRASQLLEQRLNEWLGSHRSPRFLLNPWELWLIWRQKSYLTWGTKRQQKERLITASWRAIYQVMAGVATIGVLLALIWWGWQTPPAQLWQIRRDLIYWSMKVDDKMAGQAAVAFAKDGNFAKVEKICDREVQDPIIAAETLIVSAAVANKLQQTETATSLQQKAVLQLKKALASAQQIDDSDDRAEALTVIAETYIQLKDSDQASKLLEEALASAQQIDYFLFRAEALTVIAEAYIKLKNSDQASKLLEKALSSTEQIAQQIDNSYVIAEKLIAEKLRAIAEAYIKLKNSDQASKLLEKALSSTEQVVDSSYRAEELGAIASVSSQLKDSGRASNLLEEALASAQQIVDNEYRAEALGAIASASSQLKDSGRASNLLEEALASAQQIVDNEYRAKALRAIASASSQLKDSDQASNLLEKALASAQQIDDNEYRAEVLRAIASVSSQLKVSDQASNLFEKAFASAQQIVYFDNSRAELLRVFAEAYVQLTDSDQVLASAEQIDSFYYRAEALKMIAEAYIHLQDSDQASNLLEKALASAEQIDHSYYVRAKALREIAEAYVLLQDLDQASNLLEKALASAEQIDHSSSRAELLREIAEAYVLLQDSDQASNLLEKALASAEQIHSSYARAEALRAIAEAYVLLQDSDQASNLLEKALASAEQIDHSYYFRAEALRAIAEAYVLLQDSDQASNLLEEALASAEQIHSSYARAEALRAIAKAYIQLKDSSQASKLIEEALASAQQIVDSEYRAEALGVIASASSQLKDSDQASNLFDKALASADQIDSSDNRAKALEIISEIQAKLGNWSQVRHIALDKCPNNGCKVELLAHALTVRAEQQHPQLVDKDESSE